MTEQEQAEREQFRQACELLALAQVCPAASFGPPDR